MKTEKIIKKILVIGFLAIFLSVSNITSAFDADSNSPQNNRQDPIPYLEGQFGKNFWYISDVKISFYYDPELVSEIYLFLDGEWFLYEDVPVVVSKEGIYLVTWKWFDKGGYEYEGIPPISFKIDQTPPTIQLTKKSGGKNKVIFTAAASDPGSQIERVEFYLDDVLNQTITEHNYIYTWTGEDKHWVYAIAYNFAGLSEKSKNLSTPRLFFSNHYFIQRFFSFIQMILFRYQK